MDKMDFYTALSPTVLPLLKWYQAGHRDLPWRQNPTPYQVWISEIMLQQTRVQAVIPYYHRFLSLFPDVAALAQAPEEQLLKAWEGLGYYSRARNLQRPPVSSAIVLTDAVLPATTIGSLCLG